MDDTEEHAPKFKAVDFDEEESGDDNKSDANDTAKEEEEVAR